METNFLPYSLEVLYLRVEGLKRIEDSPSKERITKQIDQTISQLQKNLEEKPLRQLETSLEIISRYGEEFIRSSDIEPSLQNNFNLLIDTIKQKANEKLLSAPLSAATFTSEKRREQSHLNLFFACDFGCPDHNGTILQECHDYIESNIPILTTRSLLIGKHLKESSLRESRAKDLRNYLEDEEKWALFQVSGSDLVLLFPLTYPFPFEELGFNREKLKKMSFSSLLEDAYEENSALSIDTVADLFDKNHAAPKRIVLDGHGDEKLLIGGLSIREYQKFLSLLTQINTAALVVQSCYGGGANKLLQTAAEEKEKRPAKVKFPIILESIGSFKTYASDKNKTKFFASLGKGLELAPTSSNISYHQAISEGVIFEERNLGQIAFPQNLSKLPFFRPFSRNPKACTITISELKKKLLTLQKNGINDAFPTIRLSKKKMVNLLPSVVEATLLIEGKISPFLYSSSSGQSHHYVETLALPEIDFLDFFQANAGNYCDSKARKAFFFHHITADNPAENVVFDFNGTISHCYFQEDDPPRYFSVTCQKEAGEEEMGMDMQEIDAEQFALAVEAISEATTPTEAALFTATGGQETIGQFKKCFHGNFWKNGGIEEKNNDSNIAIAFIDYLERPEIERKEKEIIRKLIEQVDSPTSRQALLLAAMATKNFLLAETLIATASDSVDLNSKLDGLTPLIHLAIENNEETLLAALIEKGADLGVRDSDGLTPLMKAAHENNLAMIDLLLENSSPLDIEAKCNLDATVLFYAESLEVIKKIEQRASINVNDVTVTGATLLSVAVLKNDKLLIEYLLKRNADPLLGDPSALEEALAGYNRPVVELFLRSIPTADLGVKFLNKAALSSLELLQVVLKAKEWSKKDISAAGTIAFHSLSLKNGRYLKGLEVRDRKEIN